ncbi:MAG: exo-alpha-sialidase [Gammaproteobacteria bacterium]|nr:exo-alpha-sialidase [Gammaproteobacteria bacterium]NIR82592.1 exo-alpha-sialidase [Gammaproteobacteria bacterium]NIR88795.1 exo-alpha-sialidase [Gammaproteobacteria bacterium]NIV74000.1 exo-alpha-sialidase [Gammaproteobacteria bacterium]
MTGFRSLPAILAGLALSFPAAAPAQGSTSVEALARSTHFHGIAVDRGDPSRLYLATHHGLYAVSADGSAVRVSREAHDFMGFVPDPVDPAVLYGSGHPAGGGNLGFIVSGDGGKTWEQRAEGARGPVDFHQLDVSAADPDVMYGVFGGLQVSRDAGRSWRLVGPAPQGLIDLAASAIARDRIYAATQRGLLVSRDAGASWMRAHPSDTPATLVTASGDGRLYAFIVGVGLVSAGEAELAWRILQDDFGPRFILHLAVDPSNPERLYAITYHGETRESGLVASADGGRTWRPLGR